MIEAAEALERLREGNRRFVAGAGGAHPVDADQRRELVAGQDPFAVVLGCSDSRVPVETVFDQGLGELFVIRVAGNVASPSTVGSVEFAVESLDTRLVVVLGHSQCGAIQATVDQMDRPTGLPESLRSIVDRIRPAVEPLFQSDLRHDREALVSRAVRANVEASASDLPRSPVLAKRIRDGGLVVAGAVYALETGAVDFFD